jgi:hypothetical protein
VRTLFREGERVIVDFDVGDPQLGEIVAASDDGKSVTVRLDAGIMGYDGSGTTVRLTGRARAFLRRASKVDLATSPSSQSR